MIAKKFVTVVAALAMAAQPVLAAESPYFRFVSGKDGADASGSLRFSGGTPLSDGVVGTPVSASYVATGGKQPYAMELLDAPTGLGIAKTADDAWKVTGTLSPVGSFAGAAVRLTDATGTSVSFAVPVNVLPASTPSTEAPLAFASGEALTDGTVGTPVRTTYVAKGGKPPYAMALSNAPGNLTVSKSNDTTWVVTGTLGPAGSYPNAKVSLTDSSPAQAVTFAVPVTVADNGTAPALSFASNDPIPSGMVGTRVRSYFQAAGGKPPYAMKLVSAPPGITMTQASSDTFAASGAFTQPGTYDTALVQLTDSADPTGVTVAVPVDVTPAPALAFTRTSALPATFKALSTQTAPFAVSGGVAPYSWAMVASPSTIAADAYSTGNATVVGVVEKAGTYSGVAVQVTDAVGATVVSTLPDFTVTDGGATKLQVSNLAPLPATVAVGQTFRADGIEVRGSGSSGAIYVTPYGGGSNGAAAGNMTLPYGQDPVKAYATFTGKAEDAGQTFDVSILFQDYDNPDNKALVPWGKVAVAFAPLALTKQFDPLYQGKAGSRVEAYARLSGGSGNYSVAIDQPAGSNLSFNPYGCAYTDCSSYGAGPGEEVIGGVFQFSQPGVIKPFRVSVTDNVTGEKAFFDSFAVETQKTDPMVKISEFQSPLTIDAGPYGATLPFVAAKVRNGTSLVTVTNTITPSQPAYIGGSWVDCTDPSGYQCQQAGSAAGENLITLYGSLPAEGTFNIGVTADDPGSASTVTFAPLTVTVNPPPLSRCTFNPINITSGTASTTPNAITFYGGLGPFNIVTTGATGIMYGAPNILRNANRSVTASVAADATATGLHVKVTDSRNQSCEGDVTVQNYGSSTGDAVTVVAVRQYMGFTSTSNFLTADSAQPVFTVNEPAADFQGDASGPMGVHPSTTGIYLGFVPPAGLTVTGVQLASVQTPVGDLRLLGANQYGYSQPDKVYMQDLNYSGQARELLPGDYNYTFSVFLSDGTYRQTDVVTIRLN